MKIRQPIVTVAGHVDHGKTTLLDFLRGSSIADKEAGRITQKISFTLFPKENIEKSCNLLDKYNIKLKIPGFLFIDTPGHQAFTNLRKHGGSLADLAILVIDINEGIMPQTAEVLQILKANKTPFIIALNKIDRITGWRKQREDVKEDIEAQSSLTKQDFQEKFYTLVGSLESHGFKSDLFFNIEDFSKKICLVPISAKTGEGIPELLMVLCGLSQKFLSKKLKMEEKGRGVVFEIIKTKTMNYVEAVLYDGKLKVGDEIAVASFGDVNITKIRALEEVYPLSDKFESVKEVTAATGIRIHTTSKQDILPGMPFQVYFGDKKEIEREFKKELSEIKLDKQGIIVKADSLGTLEALITLLRQSNIQILKAGIGPVNKLDITKARASKETNPEDVVIIAFNVVVDEEAKDLEKEVKIISGDVIYKLLEDLEKWREETNRKIEREKMMGLVGLCKLEILHKYVFRNSKPAIFGVKVLGGKLKSGISLINEQGEKIQRVKAIQDKNQSIQEATSGMEIAISLPGISFDRQLKDSKFLYSDMSETQFREFKKNKELLSGEEIKILQEIAEIKRKDKITWGV